MRHNLGGRVVAFAVVSVALLAGPLSALASAESSTGKAPAASEYVYGHVPPLATLVCE